MKERWEREWKRMGPVERRNLWSLAQEPVDPMLYLNQVLNEIKKDEFRHWDIHGFPYIIHIFARNAFPSFDMVRLESFFILFPFCAFQESNPPKALRAEHLFKLNEVCRGCEEKTSLKSDTREGEREDKVIKRRRWQGDQDVTRKKRKTHAKGTVLKILYDASRRPQSCDRLKNDGISIATLEYTLALIV